MGQSTLNCIKVFWSWAFGARVCWLTASFKACVCSDVLRSGRNCCAAAARGAGDRLELEVRALILLLPERGSRRRGSSARAPDSQFGSSMPIASMVYCPRYDNCRRVCEAHPDRSREGEHACGCGAPGEPCSVCNRPEDDEASELPEGFRVEIDEKGWRH